ncbi:MULTISPECIES: ABC transporter substrate-binding protein [unclassified Sporosarcina]|uniref:ABC transporter substrate-binding protein n=1 Tax=unclassified Sporosarcina TaxID=2647733 RepID=UPI000C16371E|nr:MULTISPECIES: ABC transporter substrate-binding protein [unclassified Sporosarcina]PID15007.1 ABC transporter substrate-binding protein [Sporosarcina sp. P34]PID25225.1 ABC transporter substrate-binding protein [Sporosarcina sp. P7]
MNKKNIFLFGIVSLISIFLVACNGGSTEGAEKGSDSDEVKLGFILSLTGNFAFMGEGIKDGIELYFEENEVIDGKKVQLIFEDDAGDPQAALRKYEQLTLKQNVDIIGGGTIGSIAAALRDKVDAEKSVPMINVVGTGNTLSWDNRSDYVWRTSFSAWQYASTAGKFAAEEVGKSTVVVSSDYVAGHEIATDFIANFEEHGGNIEKIIWAPVGTSDFSSYLTQINEIKPDSVFMFIPGADGPRFVQQYNDFGLRDKYQLIEGSAMLNAPSTIKAVADAVVGGQMITNYFPELDNAVNNEFVEKFREKYGKEPDNYAVNGYDSAQLIVEAIKKAGSVEVDQIVKVLEEGISIDSPRGPIEIDPFTNNPIQNMYVIEGKKENDTISFELIKTYEKIQMPKEATNYKEY